MIAQLHDMSIHQNYLLENFPDSTETRTAEIGGCALRMEVAPVEFPWGNPVQLGKEVGDQMTDDRGRMSEDRNRNSKVSETAKWYEKSC